MSVSSEELRDSARKVFPDWDSARDPDASWTTIAELGWFMLTVPEEHGGLGLGRAEAGVIFNECGRVLLPGPVIAQFMAVEALAGAEDPDSAVERLESAMAGEIITTSLDREGDGRVLRCVPDADRADSVLLRGPERVALASLAGAQIVATPSWDGTRRLFDVTLADGAEITPLAQGQAAMSLADRLDSLLSLALAGDALGGASALLAMTIDYLKTRQQFGRPLALFQALKHRVADLQAGLVTAEALYRATAQDGVTAEAAGALKAHACAVYLQVAEEAVQLHGGIGLTVEYPVHLFLKRAFLNAALGGDADSWEEKTGRALLARPA